MHGTMYKSDAEKVAEFRLTEEGARKVAEFLAATEPKGLDRIGHDIIFILFFTCVGIGFLLGLSPFIIAVIVIPGAFKLVGAAIGAMAAVIVLDKVIKHHNK